MKVEFELENRKEVYDIDEKYRDVVDIFIEQNKCVEVSCRACPFSISKDVECREFKGFYFSEVNRVLIIEETSIEEELLLAHLNNIFYSG